jgi:hypothetical protein
MCGDKKLFFGRFWVASIVDYVKLPFGAVSSVRTQKFFGALFNRWLREA